MSKNATPRWPETNFQLKMHKTGTYGAFKSLKDIIRRSTLQKQPQWGKKNLLGVWSNARARTSVHKCSVNTFAKPQLFVKSFKKNARLPQRPVTRRSLGGHHVTYVLGCLETLFFEVFKRIFCSSCHPFKLEAKHKQQNRTSQMDGSGKTKTHQTNSIACQTVFVAIALTKHNKQGKTNTTQKQTKTTTRTKILLLAAAWVCPGRIALQSVKQRW